MSWIFTPRSSGARIRTIYGTSSVASEEEEDVDEEEEEEEKEVAREC
jgi:hypothetical protein